MEVISSLHWIERLVCPCRTETEWLSLGEVDGAKHPVPATAFITRGPALQTQPWQRRSSTLSLSSQLTIKSNIESTCVSTYITYHTYCIFLTKHMFCSLVIQAGGCNTLRRLQPDNLFFWPTDGRIKKSKVFI